MRKIREALRLKADGKSLRQIAKSCNIGHSTAWEYLQRAESAGLSWPLPPELDDASLEAIVYPDAQATSLRRASLPDWEYIHQELKRKAMEAI